MEGRPYTVFKAPRHKKARNSNRNRLSIISLCEGKSKPQVITILVSSNSILHHSIMDPSTVLSIGSKSLTESSLLVVANKFRMGLPPVSLLSAAVTVAFVTKQRNPQGQHPPQKKQYLYPLQSAQPQLFSVLPSVGLPLATLLFVAVLATVFYFQSTGALAMGKLSLCPWRVLKKKEYYRVLSHVFIHTDKEHLMMNIVGAFIFGLECESAYGTLRLVEASAWAVVLENVVQLGLAKQTLVQIPGTSNGQAMMQAHMVGFSGILNFWLGMGFSRHFWLNFCFIGLVVAREVMRYSVKRGSIAHIAGACGGMLYSLFILDKFTIPKTWLQSLERHLPIAKCLYVPTPSEKRWYL